MAFWKFFRRRTGASIKPQRLDYLNEALALERQGDFDAALTSYRLALRDHPDDLRILQNMAIAFTKTHRPDDAIRYYRRALEIVQRLFPQKRVVPADSDETIHTMGSWHCLTHELPERL